MRGKPKAANTKDVARLAGVSLGSVSRVVNGFVNVTPQVREKVQQAMAALGYRPNPAARTLRASSLNDPHWEVNILEMLGRRGMDVTGSSPRRTCFPN